MSAVVIEPGSGVRAAEPARGVVAAGALQRGEHAVEPGLVPLQASRAAARCFGPSGWSCCEPPGARLGQLGVLGVLGLPLLPGPVELLPHVEQVVPLVDHAVPELLHVGRPARGPAGW